CLTQASRESLWRRRWARRHENKKPAMRRAFCWRSSAGAVRGAWPLFGILPHPSEPLIAVAISKRGSLDLAFLVRHVLAHHRVVRLDFHLVRRVLLVLDGRVEMTGAGGGDQADLVALGCHGSGLLRSSRRGH